MVAIPSRGTEYREYCRDTRQGSHLRPAAEQTFDQSLQLAVTRETLDKITDTERIQPLARVIAHLEKSQFGWNDWNTH